MTRVLIGSFGAIVRLGLHDFLDDEEVEVVAEDGDPEELLQQIVETLPDVVVIDLDTEEGAATARRIAAEFPSVKVIACSSVEPTMRVFPPFHRGESYRTELDPDLLIETIRAKG